MASMLREPKVLRSFGFPLTLSMAVQVPPLSEDFKTPLVLRMKRSDPTEAIDWPVPTLGATGRLAVMSVQDWACARWVSNGGKNERKSQEA